MLLRFLFALCLFTSGLSFAGGFSVNNTTTTVVSVTTTSGQIIAADEFRNYIIFQNNGSDSVIIKPASVQSGSEGVILPAGASYEPNKAFKEAVFAKSVSGTQSVAIVTGR